MKLVALACRQKWLRQQNNQMSTDKPISNEKTANCNVN